MVPGIFIWTDVEKIKVCMREVLDTQCTHSNIPMGGRTGRILPAGEHERKQKHRSSWALLRLSCFLLYPVSTEPHLRGLL